MDMSGQSNRVVAVRLRISASRARAVISTAVIAFLTPLCASGQGVVHLSTVQPGGFPGTPLLQGIQSVTNGVRITWDGPSGYYQVWEKSNSLSGAWVTVGGPTNLTLMATITAMTSNAFFRVSGPAPNYAGSQVCISCHGTVHATWMLTPHAQAFTNATFMRAGGQTNASCVVCHTVGYGLPTGFISASQTPQLEGVQCESCHGPAANHAANPTDFSVVPRVELAAQLCGGCHNAQLAPAKVVAHDPVAFAYQDWSVSPHSAVVPTVLSLMTSSSADISSCGRCHSGSARLALLEGLNPSVTLTNDYDVPITCAVCHDPHAQYVWTNELNGVITFTNSLTGVAVVITNDELGAVYTNQLRAALSSTNDFVLTTSDDFTNVYNPNINVCGQCHNDRGAAWTDTSMSPHHSPQYNILLGTVGELVSGPTPGYPSTHSRLEMQCAACHMQTATNDISGHQFEVETYQLCLNCHNNPAGLVELVTNNMAAQIQQTVSYLDLWATNAEPAGLQQYGTLAWEYTTPGDLSPSGAGPSSSDQALIPDNIKMARFDLYLVFYDGSYGVHNAPFDFQLLQAAQTFIEDQLFQ